MKYLYAALLLCAILTACKKPKNEHINSETLAPITIEFDHVVDGLNLMLDNQTYVTPQNEYFSVSLLKYYISNLVFTKDDGSIYIVPKEQSYFLVQEATDRNIISLQIPEGNYSKVSFLIGIDSITNTLDLDSRPTSLHPGNPESEGMYWAWNSGYIFFKMEGDVIGDTVHQYKYHIGGYGGYETPTINNLKTVQIDLTAKGIAKVRTGTAANIHLLVDLMYVFTGIHPIQFGYYSTVMFSPSSSDIADNYQNMFFHDHTEN